MRHGVPVIAYGRGCIPEFIASGCGLVIDPVMPFTPPALTQIKQWVENTEAYRAASRSAIERFTIAHAEYTCRWSDLEREILGGG